MGVKLLIHTISFPDTFCRLGGWGAQCGYIAPLPAEIVNKMFLT